MSEWKKTTLREVIQINPATVDRDFKSEWIEYIDISSVGEGVITESPKVIKLKEAPSRAKRLVSKNDTVISTVRPNRRSMFFVREPKQNWVLSTGFAVLRPIPDKIEPRFLYAVVFNREFTEYLISREKGAAYPAVLPEDIYEAEILLPPLSEQKAIAHILGSLDDKIELNRRMNETLEAMARAIFKDWFVDFGPTRAKIEGRAPYLPEPIWSLFPDAIDPLSGLPIGWKLGTIGECFNLVMGQSPPGETYNDNGQGLPFFQGKTDFGFRFPENRKYCTSPTRIAEANDTLVSVRAPVGDINMAWEKCCIGRGIASLRHKSGSPSFTYYSAWAIQQELFNYEHTGTVFGSITKNQLMSLSTIEPSQDFVKLFDEYVFPIDESIRVNVLKSRTLAELRDRLLPKLMSGQIRVKDAEKLVEEVL